MSSTHHRRTGFTIIEMMVVVAVIGLLLGILMPTLSYVRRTATKTREQNNIKQVYKAWSLYSNYNNESALPGYLETDVQRRWRMKYEFQDKTLIPPAPSYGANEPNIAGPWTWRLFQYIDFAHDVVRGYAEKEDVMLSISSDNAEALAIATEPSFGYNGYYVGGYWRMVNVNGSTDPRFDYFDHCATDNQVRIVIPTHVSQVRRSTEVLLFCTATSVENSGMYGPYPEDVKGAHLAGPPTMGIQPRWTSRGIGNGQQSSLGSDQIEVLSASISTPAYVPLARVTNTVVCLWADGHVSQEMYNSLDDQRKWIENAHDRNYTHDVCPP